MRSISSTVQKFLVRLGRLMSPWAKGFAPVANHQFVFWAATGLMVLGFVLLQELGRLLQAAQAAGSLSFGPGAYSGFNPTPWDTKTLRSAVEVWTEVDATAEAAGGGVVAQSIVRWHTAIDLFYVPVFACFLACAIKRLGAPGVSWFAGPLALLAADLLETVVTAQILWDLNDGNALLPVIPWLAFAKWVAVAGTVALLIGCLFHDAPDTPSVPNVVRQAAAAQRSGGEQAPFITLSWLVVLIAVFAVFVCYPAGDTLDQIPDVLRYQMLEWANGNRWPFLMAAVAIASLPFSVMAGAYASLASPDAPAGREVRSWMVLVAAALVSVVVLILQVVVDGTVSGVTWLAPLIVAAVISALGGVLALSGIGVGPAGGAQARFAGARPGPKGLAWIGGLGGVAAMVGGIGLARAALPGLVLEGGAWAWPVVVGIMVAGTGGFVMQVVVRFVPNVQSASRGLLAGAGGLTALGGLSLLLKPEYAVHWGTTGTIAICVGTYAVVLGSLINVGQRRNGWGAARRLGLGHRMPLLALLAITWLTASMLNREGGYHDAEVIKPGDATPGRYASIGAAFDAWLPNAHACTPGNATPMVFVAIPGGGAKAGYWASIGLDALFTGNDCAAHSVFAISSVSGGSVGTATWLATTKTESAGQAPSAEPAYSEEHIRKMFRDDGLASAFAALFLRDAPQPLLGIQTGWKDRAELMQERWLEAVPKFAVTDEATNRTRPLTLDEASGPGTSWTPVVAFNATSVTDGCRVILSNTLDLPANDGLNCLDTTSLTGPVSGAIDGGRAVQARGDGESSDGSLPRCSNAEDTRSRISALTAGYLSARFPGVAPSGALYRCIARPTAPGGGSVVQAAPEAPAAAPEFDRKTTYAVDGGYIEGSGILTALQMWVGVQQQVREHNAKGVNCIEPWLVVLSSGYQSSASAADPGRPLELVLPVSTFLAANPVTTAALEQTSAAVFDRKSIPCGPAAPSAKSQPHVVHLSLSTSPEVAAPLGWVLSAQTLDNMCGQLKGAFARARIPSGSVDETEPYDALGQLLQRLGFNAGATAPCTGRGP